MGELILGTVRIAFDTLKNPVIILLLSNPELLLPNDRRTVHKSSTSAKTGDDDYHPFLDI